MDKQASQAAAAQGFSALQKALVTLFSVVLVGSVAVRAATTEEPAGVSAASTPDGAMTMTAHVADPTQPAEDAQGLEQYLPYLTEASLFGLIGFALGYTSRKIFKIALILIALAFVGAQVGVYNGWFEVDWGSLVQRLNDWVFNLKQNASITEFLTDRVPTAGALLVGWLVGFKRG